MQLVHGRFGRRPRTDEPHRAVVEAIAGPAQVVQPLRAPPPASARRRRWPRPDGPGRRASAPRCPSASRWAIRLAWAAPVFPGARSPAGPGTARPGTGALDAVCPACFSRLSSRRARRLVEQDDGLGAVGPGLGAAEHQDVDAQPRDLRQVEARRRRIGQPRAVHVHAVAPRLHRLDQVAQFLLGIDRAVFGRLGQRQGRRPAGDGRPRARPARPPAPSGRSCPTSPAGRSGPRPGRRSPARRSRRCRRGPRGGPAPPRYG